MCSLAAMFKTFRSTNSAELQQTAIERRSKPNARNARMWPQMHVMWPCSLHQHEPIRHSHRLQQLPFIVLIL